MNVCDATHYSFNWLNEAHTEGEPLHRLDVRYELLELLLSPFAVDHPRVADLGEARNSQLGGPLLEVASFRRRDEVVRGQEGVIAGRRGGSSGLRVLGWLGPLVGGVLGLDIFMEQG